MGAWSTGYFQEFPPEIDAPSIQVAAIYPEVRDPRLTDRQRLLGPGGVNTRWCRGGGRGSGRSDAAPASGVVADPLVGSRPGGVVDRGQLLNPRALVGATDAATDRWLDDLRGRAAHKLRLFGPVLQATFDGLDADDQGARSALTRWAWRCLRWRPGVSAVMSRGDAD